MNHDEFESRLKAIYDDRNAGMGALADLLTVGVESCLARLDRLESPPGRRREGSETLGPVHEAGTWGWALGEMRYGRRVRRRAWNERTLAIRGREMVWSDGEDDLVRTVGLRDIDAEDWTVVRDG